MWSLLFFGGGGCQGIHQDRTTKLPAATWDVTLAISLMPHIIDSLCHQNQLRSLTEVSESSSRVDVNSTAPIVIPTIVFRNNK